MSEDQQPEAESEAVLDICDLHVSFKGRPVLCGINLQIDRGETVVILGGSGCGKSTLLLAIIGAVTPDSGVIRVLGKDLRKLPLHELDRHRTNVGMLFQSSALFNSMTVGENIACVLREHTPLDEEEIQILVQVKLEMVGLRHAEHLLPAELSGGMKKRVGLARSLSLDPAVMLYDEPGAGLDPVTMATVDRLIATLGRALNMANVVVTHKMESIERIASRVVFLHQGSVLADVTPDEIKEYPDAMIQQFISGDANGPLTEQGYDEDYALALLGERPKR